MELIYTPPDNVLELFRARRSKPEFFRGTENLFSNNYLEHFFSGNEYAVLVRKFATPNYETIRFVRKARECGLKPVIIEYPADKFSGDSMSKLSCGVLEFEKSSGREQLGICHVASFIGKTLSEVNTLWEQPLVEFHHGLMKNIPELANVPIIDMSQWFQERGRIPRRYYLQYLAIFVRHAVLFEAYLSNPDEFAFTRDIVIPTISCVTETYGAKPFIVSLDTNGGDCLAYWNRYPDELSSIVKKKLKRNMPDAGLV